MPPAGIPSDPNSFSSHLTGLLCPSGTGAFLLQLAFINIPVITAIMRVVDRDKLSKVNSIISIGCQGMIPLASMLAGIVLQSFGSSVLLFICSLGLAVTAVILLQNKAVREL